MRTTLIRTVIFFAGLSVATTAPAQSNIAELIEQMGITEGNVAMRDMPGWRTPEKIVIRDFGFSVDEIKSVLPGVKVIQVRSEAEAIGNARGADAIVGWCSDEVLTAAKGATWSQIFSAGAERCMSTERIADGSVVLTNMQKMSSPVIAEHAIALTLSLARNLPFYTRAMQDGEWNRSSEASGSMQSIAGKTLLVVGLGGIGTEVARRAAALDMRVISTRRSSREGPDFVDYVGLSHELFELAGKADFIVITVPLTSETEGLFDKKFFDAAKPGALIVNVGRGKTIVTDDLVAALKSGQVAGAALDVTDPEPLPEDHPLWQMENVLITPHVSWAGGNRAREGMLLMENLQRFAAGDALLNVVDPELGY